jgi:hypothetical protein
LRALVVKNPRELEQQIGDQRFGRVDTENGRLKKPAENGEISIGFWKTWRQKCTEHSNSKTKIQAGESIFEMCDRYESFQIRNDRIH